MLSLRGDGHTVAGGLGGHSGKHYRPELWTGLGKEGDGKYKGNIQRWEC